MYCFVFSGVYGEYRLYKSLNQLKKQIMATKPRICFICDQKADIHFPPHFLEVYGERLRNRGYQTSILAYAADINSDHAKKLMDNGVDLMSKAAPDNLAGRLFFYLRRSFGWMKVLWFKTGVKDADILFVHNDPLVGTLAWIKARLTGKKFIYRITHLMPEEALIRSDLKKHWKFLGKVAQRWRNWLIRRSDYVMPMSAEMTRSLHAQSYFPKGRVYPFESMIDFQNDNKPEKILINDIKDKMKLNGAGYWMTYVGTLSPGRELSLIIDTLKDVRDLGIDAGLLIFGVAAKPEYLKILQDYARGVDLFDCIIWNDPVPEAQLKHALALADVGLSPFPVNEVMRNNSPLKVLEYLRAEIPSVVSPIPDHEEVMRETGYGEMAEFTPHAFANAVKLIYDNPDKYEGAFKVKGKKWLHENRDLSSAINLLEKTFEKVCQA